MTQQIENLNTGEIIPGPNDRRRFDPVALQELADSIDHDGLAQPITVRPVMHCVCGRAYSYNPAHIGDAPITCADCEGELDAGFEIVAGERRYRAVSQILEKPTIAAIVRVMTDEQAAAVMLSENTGRQDLDPVDEALAYKSRMVRFGWSVEQIATRAGVSTIRVRFRLKLLNLRDELLDLVRSGDLALGYAQIISDAELDRNRQIIAIARLRDNPTPTPAWLRREVNGLLEEQAQDSLFDLAMMTVISATTEKPKPETPPTPTTDTAPTIGVTIAEVIENQIEFWTAAADEWDALGKSFKRNECQAAAAALTQILETGAWLAPTP